MTFPAHVQLGRWGSAAVRQATDLAVRLDTLCKVGHAIPVIPDRQAECQGLCRAPCLSPRSFRKVQKSTAQPTGCSASAQFAQQGRSARWEEFTCWDLLSCSCQAGQPGSCEGDAGMGVSAAKVPPPLPAGGHELPAPRG